MKALVSFQLLYKSAFCDENSPLTEKNDCFIWANLGLKPASIKTSTAYIREGDEQFFWVLLCELTEMYLMIWIGELLLFRKLPR